jgi:hypothetical protein
MIARKAAERNPPFTDDKAAGYAGACHPAAPCADPWRQVVPDFPQIDEAVDRPQQVAGRNMPLKPKLVE